MQRISTAQIVIAVSTVLFLVWTLTNTVFWPLEDYADVNQAYAESTNQIVRGMSIGIASYLSVLGVTFSLKKPASTKPQST